MAKQTDIARTEFFLTSPRPTERHPIRSDAFTRKPKRINYAVSYGNQIGRLLRKDKSLMRVAAWWLVAAGIVDDKLAVRYRDPRLYIYCEEMRTPIGPRHHPCPTTRLGF